MKIAYGFRKKMFLMLLLFTVILIFLVASLYYKHASKQDAERAEQFFIEKVANISVQVDTIIKDMDKISAQILANEQIQIMFQKANSDEYKGKNYFEYNSKDRKIAQGVLWTFNSPQKSAESINVFSNYSYVGLRSSPNVDVIKQISQLDWYTIPEDKRYQVIYPHYDSFSTEESKLVISLIRPFIATYSHFQKEGTIEVGKDYSMLEDICALDGTGEKLTIWIVEEQGQVIYPYGADDLAEVNTLSDYMSKANEQELCYGYNNQGEEIVYSYQSLQNVDWKVIIEQPRAVYSNFTKEVIRLIILVGLSLMVVSIVSLLLITHNLTKPIVLLTKEISEVSLENDITLPYQKSSIQEIEVLQTTFIRIVSELRDSANQLILSKESELNSKIAELQSKINPHFLYNSLMAISAAGQETDNNKVAIMCYQLGELFRYSSSDQDELVTMENEINHVKTYLEFMKWRYEENFKFEIMSCERLKDSKMPRLILQPIVENCFTHGFKKVAAPYYIQITCVEKKDDWSIKITDNGGGFATEAIWKLHNKLEQVDHIFHSKKDYHLLKTDDMALVNIYIRLKLHWKNAVCLRIGTDETLQGACIEIIVKKENHLLLEQRCL